jgi:molybdate transport system substrate-binding protein
VRQALVTLAATVAMLGAVMEPASAQESVRLHAAGSLRSALSEIAERYEAFTQTKIVAVFGASGLLRDRLAGGEAGEVFASANMAHPQSLGSAKKAGPTVLFARNRLCALARADANVTSATLLARMLDPTVKLGTSTPVADPAGDYAFALFARAEAVVPGARARLEQKALKLTGGPGAPPPPPGRSVYAANLAAGNADVFLAYCTAATEAKAEMPDLQIVEIPDALAVAADYGLTLLDGARPAAAQFAMFVLSPEGQRILQRRGFEAPGLPLEEKVR